MLGVQLVSVVIAIPVVLIGLLLLSINPILGIAVILIGILVAFLVVQTLEGIIKTTLYLYATEGKRPQEFDNVDFDELGTTAG